MVCYPQASAANAQTATAADTESAATYTESAATPEVDSAANRTPDRRKVRRANLHALIGSEARRRSHWHAPYGRSRDHPRPIDGQLASASNSRAGERLAVHDPHWIDA